MARIVILSVLVLAALCHVYGAKQKSGYGTLLREVRQALFKKRSQQRSESHYWCWEVLEQHRESICYEEPPATQPPKPPQPTHHHTTIGYTKPPLTHKPTDWPQKPTDWPQTPTDWPQTPTDWPQTPTYDPHTGAPYTDDPHTGAPYTDDPHTGAPYTDDPHTGAPYTDDPGTVAPAVFGEFVGAREAKSFFRKDFSDLHEECCYEGCDVEEVDEACW